MKSIGQDIAAFQALLGKSSRIVTVTHTHPDGDAAGSSLGISAFLRSLGKKVTSLFPTRIPDTLSFMREGTPQEFILEADINPEACEEAIKTADLVICLDFNAFSRIDSLEKALEQSKASKALIDHHPLADASEYDAVFSETEISSASELVFWVIMSTDYVNGDAKKLPLLCSTLLMTGMTTDTNNFGNSTYPSTLEMASKLLDAGVDREGILGKLLQNGSENRLRLMGEMLLNRMKLTSNGVSYMILRQSDIEKFGITEGDTEGFVNLPLGIAEVRLSLFLREDGDHFRVSVRSKRGTSAQKMAATYFNGGGHVQASGGKVFIGREIESAEMVEEYVRKVAYEYLEKNDK